jgi:hypothetical protein
MIVENLTKKVWQIYGRRKKVKRKRKKNGGKNPKMAGKNGGEKMAGKKQQEQSFALWLSEA